VLITLVVGLATLGIGFAAGRMPHSFGIKVSAPADTGKPLARPDQDQHQPERERVLPDTPVDLPSAVLAESAVAMERAQLVAACADLADRLRDRQPALYAVLTRDLAGVGVRLRLADGEPFDAARHNPVGTEPTLDPAADLLVAETVRAGYLDHGSVARVPEVIVYRCREDDHGN
jgi:hypothetical protein